MFALTILCVTKNCDVISCCGTG